MPNNFFDRLISIAFPIIVAGSVIMLVACAAVQQDMRQSANDPQIALAEDASATLSGGYPIDALLSGIPRTDMSRSLSPFFMVFDDSGRLISSSAYFNGGVPPTPPVGVFDFVRSNNGGGPSGPFAFIDRLRMAHSSNIRPAGEDRVTWQTPTGLRFATVVVRWDSSPASSTVSKVSSSASSASPSGFVLVARSLRETEIRESQLGLIMLGGWVVMVAGTIAAVLAGYFIERKSRLK